MSSLIVALDFQKEQEALSLVDQLDPKQCALKVGSELFTRFGAKLVKQLIARHFNVFLDLKFHDIPNTVANACKAAAEIGVWMMNVHALGGLKMMRAARESIESYGPMRPILIAVTVLTSLTEEELLEVRLPGPIATQVDYLAQLAKNANLDGIVCSAREAYSIKEKLGKSFLTVTPGIRLDSQNFHDQHRVMTPENALAQGSDYLVIGRPITQAENPGQIVSDLMQRLIKSQ